MRPLSKKQLDILQEVCDKPGRSIGEVLSHCHFGRSYVGYSYQTVSRLVSRGLLFKQKVPRSNRIHLFPTTEGRKVNGT